MKFKRRKDRMSPESIVHVSAWGAVHVDMEKQLRTPEAQAVMRDIAERFGKKTSSNEDERKKKDLMTGTAEKSKQQPE